MKQNMNMGYQLPAELVKVMDLASELNAKLNEAASVENIRLVQTGWCKEEEVREFTMPLLRASDKMAGLLNDLAEYAGVRIHAELFDKYE